MSELFGKELYEMPEDIHGKCRTKIKALESERDALVRAQQGFIELCDHDRAEIDGLKVELVEWKRIHDEIQRMYINLIGDRDQWKAKYDSLGKTVKHLHDRIEAEKSKAALAEYEK